MTRVRFLLIVGILALGPSVVAAQPDGEVRGPAFSLWSTEIFPTGERPAFSLTFQNIDHLDFRVYRVGDPLAFFANLRDPHQLGSEKPVVPQERTWIERIAIWKADRRVEIRAFFRGQVSVKYRMTRREQQDEKKVAQRQTLRYNTFAQVPLLNPSRLVASWREILPPVRDAESRRIPLDVREPGVYVVEAVSPPLKAYTIVMVSDIGLVTKTAPGQMLVYAANRATGEPHKACDVQTIVDRKVVGTAKTNQDGLVMTALDLVRPDSVVAVARCGSQVTATDPGAWSLREPARELIGYVYTDKPIYRPGHTVRIKGVLRWRTQGQLAAFDGRQAEISIADNNDKVVLRETRAVDAYGALNTSFAIPAGAALGYYTITIGSTSSRPAAVSRCRNTGSPSSKSR